MKDLAYFLMPIKSDKLVILIGPSGVGKGHICEALLDAGFVWSQTATTREPRPDDGNRSRHKHVTKVEFKELEKKGGILEKNFHNGNWYGTLKGELDQNLKSNQPVLMEIEVNGARAIKNKYPQAITIFLWTELKTLKNRLLQRGVHSEKDIDERLAIAKNEMSQKDTFDYKVENVEGNPDLAVKNILDIIKNHD